MYGLIHRRPFQPFAFRRFDHPFRVREGLRIPFKIAPLEGLHPETVEVEDVAADGAQPYRR